MKLSKGVEQGTFVILMLALSKGHRPVRSAVLSEVLGVSDSYLKKIVRKLVAAGFVRSSAAPGGGFTLARPLEQITFADVMEVFEEPPSARQAQSFAFKVFGGCEQTGASVDLVSRTLGSGWEAFLGRLEKLSLAELVVEGNHREGSVDWEERK